MLEFPAEMCIITTGEVPERSNGAVSKTVDPSRGPRVRIPASPLVSYCHIMLNWFIGVMLYRQFIVYQLINHFKGIDLALEIPCVDHGHPLPSPVVIGQWAVLYLG